jgi:hypothetical protein
MLALKQFIINKTDMDDNEFYLWLKADHDMNNVLLNIFEDELIKNVRDRNSDTLDELYDKLNRNVQYFENRYKVKYNYKLNKMKNID